MDEQQNQSNRAIYENLNTGTINSCSKKGTGIIKCFPMHQAWINKIKERRYPIMKKLLALAFALMLIFSVALADEPLTIAVSMRSTASEYHRQYFAGA